MRRSRLIRAALGLAAFTFIAILSSSSANAQAAPPQRAEILVLGTYHMANPGRDIFNMAADDVLAPKRQAEIAELLEVLKRFKPTKIAVESTVYEDRRPKQYADYLAGKYTLTANEIEQVGFRLAKELGMNRGDHLPKAKGQSQIGPLMSDVGDGQRVDSYLKSCTIPDAFA
jgi:hypothetical protein